jgi:hypothetical protein
MLRKLELSRLSFGKFSNITLHENSSSGNRVVPCGRTKRWVDRQTDITKLIVKEFIKLIGDIRNFAKALKRETSKFFGVVVWIWYV